jgi:HSP20 family molecular chaperone IbpA
MRFENKNLSENNWEALNRMYSLAGGTIVPIVKYREDESGASYSVRLPGISENRFRVEILKGVLLISYWLLDENGKASRHMACSLSLPDYVNWHLIDARFKNGVLLLRIPFSAMPSPLDPTLMIYLN